LTDPANAGAHEPAAQGQAGIHRRIATGIASKIVSIGLVFGEQLMLVPVFLLYWGPEKYGHWLALFSTAAFLSLADIGLQNYYSNALHRARSRSENDRFRRLLHQATTLYLTIIALLGSVSLAVFLAVDWEETLNIGLRFASSAPLVLCLLGLYFLIVMPMGVLIAIHRAHGNFSRAINASNIYRASLILAIAATLSLGGGPLSMAGIYILVTLGFYTAFLLRIRRHYGQTVTFRISWPDPVAIRDLVHTAPLFALVPLSMMLTINGTVILIAGLAGSGAVVVAYTTIRTLTGIVRTVTAELAQVAGVEIARQHAQEDFEAMDRLYRFTARLAGSSCGVLAGLIAVIGPPFLEFWTVGKVAFAPQIFWPLLAAAALAGPSSAGVSVLLFINRPQGLALGYILSGLAVILMCLVLIPALGASGAAWAILAAEIGVLGIIIPLKTSQVVPVGAIRQIAVTHCHALLGFSVSAAAASAAIALTGQESIGALVVAGTLWIAIAGVPIFFLLFEKEKRHWLLKKFRDRLARSKQP
tara:strand:+ start:1196 stop:2785 length:1590 start_codon:yes stop_codon:yes gene_type:complete